VRIIVNIGTLALIRVQFTLRKPQSKGGFK
jgi:hypothetical protein